MQCFSLTTNKHIAHLVLDRPEAMNMLNPTFWRELDDVLTQLHKEGLAGALLISSNGKHFSACCIRYATAGAFGSNRQVLEAVTAMKRKSPAEFAPLSTLRSFRELA